MCSHTLYLCPFLFSEGYWVFSCSRSRTKCGYNSTFKKTCVLMFSPLWFWASYKKTMLPLVQHLQMVLRCQVGSGNIVKVKLRPASDFNSWAISTAPETFWLFLLAIHCVLLTYCNTSFFWNFSKRCFPFPFCTLQYRLVFIKNTH